MLNSSRQLRSALLTLSMLAVTCGETAGADDERPVDFGRDVRPLLADRCFRCHGPDAETREAGLRLDTPGGAVAELDSGNRAVVPGDEKASELLRRVRAEDEGERMPPPEAGPPLNDDQRRLLAAWIRQGATFARHWSFTAPVRPDPPRLETHPLHALGAIDRFVVARLEEHGLKPSPEASRETLVRRLTLDLTGLPPTIEEVDRFVADRSPDAYERLVDRLLASPAFGERWARPWLDLARYADSAGYAQDPERAIWRYRDWVIDALNENLPFDRFTIQQLAGDMLDDPTEEQLLATAFHRNTMTNSEGGTDDEEFRNAAVVDRVNTTMQVWMGITMGCAQCHTHKYDPITQQEYFRFFAIMNNTEDADRGDEQPTLVTLSRSDRIRRDALRREAQELRAEISAGQPESPSLPERSGPLRARFVRVELPAKGVFLSLAEVQALTGDVNVAPKGKARQTSVDFDGPADRAIDGNTDGDYSVAKSVTHTAREDEPWWEVELDGDYALDRVVIWNRTDNGLQHRLNPCRVIVLDERRRPIWIETIRRPPDPRHVFNLPKTWEEVDEQTREALAEYHARHGDLGSPEHVHLAEIRKRLDELKGTPTPIMRELPADRRRETHLQYRGSFLDKGPQVEPGLPSAFHSPPPDSEPNRLTMARWLVDRRNPLTARVAVNRVWEQLFGTGLVETAEDFGLQGSPPTHPRLLDHLAVEFMESGWDTKRLIRSIVCSATYRRSSRVTAELAERDPDNRWLARGPRFRLSAEMIRDQALSVAGLLSRKTHGPSVRPPRPVLGLRAAFGGSTDWRTSPGEDRYRRGLYTSWRRTTPYPSMTTFDAPSREFCTVRRIRTNTPLQALVTLNDPVYVEAAQALARRVLRRGGADDDARAAHAFRLCLARRPTDEERNRLVELYRRSLARLEADEPAARRLATDPLGPLPPGMDPAVAAAWTVVGNVLLNLDETLAKR